MNDDKPTIHKTTIYISEQFQNKLKSDYQRYKTRLNESNMVAKPLSYSGWLLNLIGKASELIKAKPVECTANA